MRWFCVCVALCLAATATEAQVPEAVSYRVSFPAPEHHWLEVEATFPDLGPQPFHARMSRSSPGRYAIHEFARNVFALDAYDGRGRPLTAVRSGADEWEVANHTGLVRIVYRIFGDQADGTYLAVDTTHAHLNMPATFLWGVGLEMRPIRVTFMPAADSNWRAATQLLPTSEPFSFTAPNLQYFMDSPTELSAFVASTFVLPNPDGTTRTFRIVAHSDATQADLDEFAKPVARLLREQQAVYGEFPVFEPGSYTFLLDYLPWVDSDGMEHRNSTVISMKGSSLRTEDGRRQVLEAIAHEFFHAWNVERIRPIGLEPFDFTRENVTCCLWLAEGFTQYYGDLLLVRASLGDEPPVGYTAAVMNGTGRVIRSAVEMSEHAPFADPSASNDMTDESRTFVSYYTYGAALALALDLSLRERSGGRTTLDDYMRALWLQFGRSADPRPGYVARPYSLADLQDVLAQVARDEAFARTFVDRYISGHDLPDYVHLLALAGYAVEPVGDQRGWVGTVAVAESPSGLRVGSRQSGGRGSLVPFDTPLYEAGVDEGDVITQIDGAPATLARWNAIAQRRPGDRVAITIERRDGRRRAVTLAVRADPRIRVAPAPSNPRDSITPAQRAFRDSWLATRVQ